MGLCRFTGPGDHHGKRGMVTEVGGWEQEQDVEPGSKSSKPTPVTSSSKTPPPKGSITSPNSVTSWEPRVQIQEPMEDISHSNLHRQTDDRETDRL